MDLQADINWIKAQLDRVTDPDLITAMKSMLNYRNKKEEANELEELSPEQKRFLDHSLEQAKQGNTVSSQEVHSKIEKLLSEK